jgi:hypothetical protein
MAKVPPATATRPMTGPTRLKTCGLEKAPDGGARRMNSPVRYQTMNTPLTMLSTPAAVGRRVLAGLTTDTYLGAV